MENINNANPIFTITNRKLSLWQSSVTDMVRKGMAEKNRTLDSDIYNERRVKAAAFHVAADAAGIPIPVVAPDMVHPDDKNTVDPKQAYISKLFFELAEANAMKNGRKIDLLMGEARKYSDADLEGWLQCAETFADTYLPFGKLAAPMYRDWKTDGNNDLNFGVIDFLLPDTAKVAIIGDWGTGMDDSAQLLLRIMEDHSPDAIIHLGDIYYSGTTEECALNFSDVFDNVFAKTGKTVPVFTIPGNHDYYAGGAPFYQMLDNDLNKTNKTWKQEASYFCLRTESGKWQILGMDTGVNDYDPIIQYAPTLKDSEIEWHQDKLKDPNVNTILLSHHQFFSANSAIRNSSTPWINEYLKKIFQPYFREQIPVWYWGHEHNFAVFENGQFGLERGRLVGASAFEEQVSEDPYKSNYPNIKYLDPNNFQLGMTDGYFNHNFAILDFGASSEGIKASYYEYPSWAGINKTPPTDAPVLFNEIITPLPPVIIGDAVKSNDLVQLIAQGNLSINAAQLDQDPVEATKEYFPILGAESSAINLRIIGPAAGTTLEDGMVVQIQTTESNPGAYNLLGAWRSTDLFYSKAAYPNENWIIKKRDSSLNKTIHYGEDLFLVNEAYSGQSMMQDGAGIFMTSESKTHFFWHLKSKVIPKGGPVNSNTPVKLMTQDGKNIISQKEGYSSTAASSEYYPRLGPVANAVSLQILGAAGNLKDGMTVQIMTMESSVGKYNVLGAWKDPSLYYFTPGFPEQNWTIHKLNADIDPVIHFGDEVYFVNQSYVNQWLCISSDQVYLTSVADAHFYWIFGL
jgi:hypothetical protein